MLGILDRPQTLLGSWQACLFSWPVPGLPLLFLWASESNVRHCGPPPNPSRQLAGQPATLGILDRPQILLGSWQACLFSSYGLPKATLGIVDRPQTPLGSWQACLFSWPVPGLPLLSYGLPKATLGIVDRPKELSPATLPCLVLSSARSMQLVVLSIVRVSFFAPGVKLKHRQLRHRPQSSNILRWQNIVRFFPNSLPMTLNPATGQRLDKKELAGPAALLLQHPI